MGTSEVQCRPQKGRIGLCDNGVGVGMGLWGGALEAFSVEGPLLQQYDGLELGMVTRPLDACSGDSRNCVCR